MFNVPNSFPRRFNLISLSRYLLVYLAFLAFFLSATATVALSTPVYRVQNRDDVLYALARIFVDKEETAIIKGEGGISGRTILEMIKYWMKPENRIILAAYVPYGFISRTKMHMHIEGDRITLRVQYRYGKQDEMEIRKRGINVLASLVTPDMPNVTKAELIHDWIITHAVYNLEGDENKFTDKGVILNGKAVCAGFATAFSRLMSMTGAPVLLVEGAIDSITGEIEPHDWNMFYNNGKWYHIDVSGDDCVYYRIGTMYRYFAKSDEYIRKDHYWTRQELLEILEQGTKYREDFSTMIAGRSSMSYPKAPENYKVPILCFAEDLGERCSIFHPEKCDKIGCLLISGEWRNGKCVLSFEVPRYSCDENHLTLCRDYDSCVQNGGVWVGNVCLPEFVGEQSCENLGGYLDGTVCRDSQGRIIGKQCMEGPKPVPNAQEVKQYEGDPAEAPLAYIDGKLVANFNYAGPVNIVAAVVDCDSGRLWWIGPNCNISDKFQMLGQGVTKKSCASDRLSIANGQVYWLVTPEPFSGIESYDWDHGVYELMYYSFRH